MKKVIAALLVLTVAVCFAACKKKDTTPSTSLPDLSADFSASQIPTSADEQPVEPNGILLTTMPGETQPTVATTQFVPDLAAVSSITTLPNAATSQFTVPSMTTPPVVTSQQPGVTYVTVNPIPSAQTPSSSTPLPSSLPTVTTPTSTTTTAPTSTTTTAPTTTTKAPVKAVNAHTNFAGYSGKKLTVEMDAAGWDGRIVAKSGNVQVKIDNETKTVPATVSGSSAGSNPTVVIDLSNVAVPEGAKITYSVPPQMIQSSEGQFNQNTVSGTYQIPD